MADSQSYALFRTADNPLCRRGKARSGLQESLFGNAERAFQRHG